MFDYGSRMDAFPVPCLFFLTDLLLWVGKGEKVLCGRGVSHKRMQKKKKTWQESRANGLDDSSYKGKKNWVGGRYLSVNCLWSSAWQEFWGFCLECSHSGSQSPQRRCEKGGKVLLGMTQRPTKCYDEATLKLNVCLWNL